LGLAPAVAADLPARTYKAPVAYVAPVYDWTGFYIGVNGGWGQSKEGFDYLGYNVFGSTATGGTFGGQIGYNWQAGSWVFGIEAQGNWADFNKSATWLVFPDTYTVGTKVDAFGLFTGRVGYAVNNALFYVKGGAAVVENKYYANWNTLQVASVSNSRWGAAVGAGFEYGFTPNWSFAVEYNHAWLGNNDFGYDNRFVGRYLNVNQDLDLVTAKINYRWGGPVVAKY
jgi:outer membrane immunogenic protein